MHCNHNIKITLDAAYEALSWRSWRIEFAKLYGTRTEIDIITAMSRYKKIQYCANIYTIISRRMILKWSGKSSSYKANYHSESWPIHILEMCSGKNDNSYMYSYMYYNILSISICDIGTKTRRIPVPFLVSKLYFLLYISCIIWWTFIIKP